MMRWCVLPGRQARGAQLVLSILLNGEMSVSLMREGRTLGVPFMLLRNGVWVTLGLPRWTADDAATAGAPA
ncbi:hypothetical protein [Paraburkholderia sp. BR14374]|uniref:hypothetical protein n=1 Tax=Paraburkholderia sp. BR14374 TaxID=3237007 RepID=UPI0034CFA47C